MTIVDGWKVWVEERFSLGIEPSTNQCALAFPVFNGLVEYEEYYVVPQAWFDDPEAHETEIRDTLRKARAREFDQALIFKPGSKRGYP